MRVATATAPCAAEVPAAAAPIYEALTAAAARYAGHTAVSRGGEAWSYELLLQNVDRARRWLLGQVEQGPVLFVAQNTPASLAFLLGSICSGRLPLLADPAWGAKEIEGIVRRCGVRALAWDGVPPADLTCAAHQADWEGIALWRVTEPVHEGPSRLRPDTAFGRFTSGTSGFSQCLQFPARAALAAAASWRQAAGLSAHDRVLCLATLNNGLAFNTSVLALLLTGGTLAFHPGRLVGSSLARSFAAVRPTVLMAFPFVYELLVGRQGKGPEVHDLRLAVSSAAPLPPGVRDRWQELTGLKICDYYGLAEVGPCTFNDGTQPGSVGVALPGASFAVTDEDGRELPVGTVGRIRVLTQSMASDYLDALGPGFADNLDGHGYYVTRDLGRLTPEGRLVLHGRVGRMVNIAGRKIDPAEVETALRELPGVQKVVVRGEETAERTVLAAYIESSTLRREEVVQFCLARLAQYKIPQQVTILPQLPRSSAGKVSLGRIEAIRNLTGLSNEVNP